jgi:hypothetical protein
MWSLKIPRIGVEYYSMEEFAILNYILLYGIMEKQHYTFVLSLVVNKFSRQIIVPFYPASLPSHSTRYLSFSYWQLIPYFSLVGIAYFFFSQKGEHGPPIDAYTIFFTEYFLLITKFQ